MSKFSRIPLRWGSGGPQLQILDDKKTARGTSPLAVSKMGLIMADLVYLAGVP